MLVHLRKSWFVSLFNPFTSHPCGSEVDSSVFDFGHVHSADWGVIQKIQNRMANSIDSDEMAHYEPSHLVLHCLQRYNVYVLLCRADRVKLNGCNSGSWKNFLPSQRGTNPAEENLVYCLLCWGLTTRQPLWVILCRLPEKGRKEIEEIVEEMKERNREERGTGMKGKKRKK